MSCILIVRGGQGSVSNLPGYPFLVWSSFVHGATDTILSVRKRRRWSEIGVLARSLGVRKAFAKRKKTRLDMYNGYTPPPPPKPPLSPSLLQPDEKFLVALRPLRAAKHDSQLHLTSSSPAPRPSSPPATSSASTPPPFVRASSPALAPPPLPPAPPLRGTLASTAASRRLASAAWRRGAASAPP